ncbi:unnamed protein product [Cyprideis torosa]|uniref:long-chain-fatty-acid--CoA ligase n=1 Tax=Cyprideis torosa TaxID=163714 RepID=A0A7R8ZMV6_9CRUS|nr:unnamed protein product [Cyprideis torosa]CAG0886457.1 unnamed protein product [Cyprideis torosa]
MALTDIQTPAKEKQSPEKVKGSPSDATKSVISVVGNGSSSDGECSPSETTGPFDALVESAPSTGPDRLIPSTKIYSCDPSDAVRLNVGNSGISAINPMSVPSMLIETVKKNPDHLALRCLRAGSWEEWTYKQYLDDVRTVAKAFIKLGLEKHNSVCILGFNSPEWFLSSLGSIFAGGISAGVYTTNSIEATKHCGVASRANIFVVENEKQLSKVLAVKSELPHLKTIIQYIGEPVEPSVLSWKTMMKIGREEEDTDLDQRLREMAVNQACDIIFTSGTTGLAKAALLTHDNITFTTRALLRHVGMRTFAEHIVSYLPLSHIAAQLVDMFTPILGGATVTFAKPDALKGSLVDTLKQTRPTIFLGVPRVWEKFYEKMMDVARNNSSLKKIIAGWAKATSLNYHRNRISGKGGNSLAYSVFKHVVFKKVKEALGLDRCNFFFSGAAPISDEILEYFLSLDIPIYNVYGMSECTGPTSLETYDRMRVSSVGTTVGGFHNRIFNPDKTGEGEVCMKGRHVFMGYLGQEEKTKEAIDSNGWLHSGDLGRKDEDGFIFITGRIKELIITAGAENVAPVPIEDNIKHELPCISNIMVIGDRKKFLSCILTLKTMLDADTGEPKDELLPITQDWFQSLGKKYKTVSEVLQDNDAGVMKAFEDGIARANHHATSQAQKVQKFKILSRDFSIPTGELGPTMKLKRPVVQKMYQKEIDSMY